MDSLYERVASHLVGRRQEVMVILAALQAGRNVFLEGPPGTSKSTILKAVVDELKRPLYWVAGNSDLTATKLLGSFDPALVLSAGYRSENFEYGALTRAMQEGGVLYIEEFNRLSDDTSNALISAMSERAIPVPRLGTVHAAADFCVVASLNPHDDIGTLRISRALRDRFCSLWMDYQNDAEECAIVARHLASQVMPTWLDTVNLIDLAVKMCRRTRAHDDIQAGASVRGAIDMSLIAAQLLLNDEQSSAAEPRTALVQMAARAALRDKIRLNDVIERNADTVIDEIWADLAAEHSIENDDYWRLAAADAKKKQPETRLTS